MAKQKTITERVDQVTGEIAEYLRSTRKRSFLTKSGRENPDPTPMAPPVGYNRQPTLAERVREMVRSEKLRLEAEAAGAETFEEADDFDVPDEWEPRSQFEIPWEYNFDPHPEPKGGQGAPEAPAQRPEALEGPEATQPQNSPQVQPGGTAAPSTSG